MHSSLAHSLPLHSLHGGTPLATPLATPLTAHLATHLGMAVVAVGLAIAVRCWPLTQRILPPPPSPSWGQRWRRALVQFVLPPLMLLSTAIALVWMGPRGQMVCPWEGWSSYGGAIAFLVVAAGLGLDALGQAWVSIRRICAYPERVVQGYTGRWLDHPMPFVAQVGLWRSHLVVSQGVLDLLDAAHLQAVLVHEQAHQTHHDPFWFFVLGWLRRVTAWLPRTQALWQELLLLRELRADQVAAQQVDGLLLAEALLAVASQAPLWQTSDTVVGLTGDRLAERIDALLADPVAIESPPWTVWALLGVGFLPLLVIPFHS
jgi:Zn-dependent protease with chaperone function